MARNMNRDFSFMPVLKIDFFKYLKRSKVDS